MTEHVDIQSPPRDLNELFQSAMQELQAVDSEQYVRRSVSRARVLELSNTLITSLAPLVDVIDMQLSELLAKQRRLELGRLSTRAWVFYKADLASEELRANTERKQRRALARAVNGHDRFLFKWAMPMFGDDPEHAETLRDISRGMGARDDAEDVLRLADLYLDNWQRIEALHHVVTRAYIEGAVADATKQLDLLTHGSSNPARKLADAAYSLWCQDYNQLMHLGRYLSRGEPDSITRFPGVRELMSARSGEGEALDDGEALEDADEELDAMDEDESAEDPNAAA